MDWLTIGRKPAADPAINSDRVAYPQGYGIDKYKRGLEPPSDKRLIELACEDVTKALRERSIRSLPAQRRREIADASTPQLRAQLAQIERGLALYRSPGAMAAVLTEGREMPAAVCAAAPTAGRRGMAVAVDH
ncbi:hypothetical protein ADK86_19450 [Streptomyces sp. NRRL F-5755]|uniref:hypothetical protein n=1 Tax=Streptomyces sp. NRRL F-5755 TaxID=1519475 RepID=UPI0006B01B2A|nr:hypothetical protein [Streptomyces sp. NRRL F-5755]KOT93216.1 hypothetical protein ADK86_19450 [Streptomyces sp. NRRL F-5755]